MSSIKKVLIIKVLVSLFCVAIGIVSFFLIADKLGSVDFHEDTIIALDKSRSKVMELAAAAVASSSAITLLPGDVGTPIAQELADMSKYFLIVLCAIYLEKFLLTVTGFIAFKYIIPVACLLFIVFIASNEKIFAKIATKLFLFALVISFTIPISVNIARMIESNYASSIQSTLDSAKENYAKYSCKFSSLSNFDVLIKLLAQSDYLTQDEAKIALEWSKNPEKWGK